MIFGNYFNDMSVIIMIYVTYFNDIYISCCDVICHLILRNIAVIVMIYGSYCKYI